MPIRSRQEAETPPTQGATRTPLARATSRPMTPRACDVQGKGDDSSPPTPKHASMLKIDRRGTLYRDPRGGRKPGSKGLVLPTILGDALTSSRRIAHERYRHVSVIP